MSATVTSGRFEVVAERARWGVGRCVVVNDRGRHRRALLKQLPRVVSDASTQVAWKALGDHLSRLGSAQVVAVVESGWWEERPFMLLEEGDGVTLGAWIGERRATRSWPALDMARAILARVCKGVSAAHRLSAPAPMVHGFLTPESVVIDVGMKGEPDVAVMDFGLARIAGAGCDHAELGCLDPTAPEQWTDGGAASLASDVFALGVLAIQVLIPDARERLRRPLRELPWTEAEMAKHLGAMRQDVDATVWEAIAQALRRDPRQRPADAERLGSILRRARWEPVGIANPMPAPDAPVERPESERPVALPSALVADVGPLPMHMRMSARAAAQPLGADEPVATTEPFVDRGATHVDVAPPALQGETTLPTGFTMEDDGEATLPLGALVPPGRLGARAVGAAPPRTIDPVDQKGVEPERVRTPTLPQGAMRAAPRAAHGAETLPLGRRIARSFETFMGRRSEVVAGDDWVDVKATSRTIPIGREQIDAVLQAARAVRPVAASDRLRAVEEENAFAQVARARTPSDVPAEGAREARHRAEERSRLWTRVALVVVALAGAFVVGALAASVGRRPIRQGEMVDSGRPSVR